MIDFLKNFLDAQFAFFLAVLMVPVTVSLSVGIVARNFQPQVADVWALGAWSFVAFSVVSIASLIVLCMYALDGGKHRY